MTRGGVVSNGWKEGEEEELTKEGSLLQSDNGGVEVGIRWRGGGSLKGVERKKIDVERSIEKGGRMRRRLRIARCSGKKGRGGVLRGRQGEGRREGGAFKEV